MRDALLLVTGLALLTYAADRFVLGAARLSSALRVAPVLIGAIVIGFGTSAPELLVSTLATVQGSQDLAFGNIVGSNSANLLLVLGAAALIRPLGVQTTTMRRELPLMLVATGVLTAVAFDRRVVLIEGLVLLAVAAVSLTVIVRTGLQDREAAAALEAEVAEYEGEAGPAPVPAALLALAGLIGTLAGAQLLVTGATGVARALGVSEAVIGLTVVAVGTSLPELVTAVAAARRNEPDLVVGNVLGSNLFNSVVVGGVSGVLATATLDETFRLSLGVMVGASLLAALFLRTGHLLVRWEALLLLIGFVATTAWLF